FPADKIDLSTPEASYATQKNLIVSNRPDKWEQLSNMTQGRPPIPERERRGMEQKISEDWTKTYREKFDVFEVFVLEEKYAFVFGLRRFDMLYDGNYFIQDGGEWLNKGNEQSLRAEEIAANAQRFLSQYAQAANVVPPADGGIATQAGVMTHMIVFGPKGDFNPRNARDYLNLTHPKHGEFGIHSGYFRPKVENGKLIAYFLTSTPDGYKNMVESIPQFEYIRTEKLTQEMFNAYEKTQQESLPGPRMLEIEQTDWYQKLTEPQKRYVQWDEDHFAYAYDPKNYDVGDDRAVFERRWLAELEKPEPGWASGSLGRYDEAILGLAMIKSDKALQPLVKIAAEKVVKDNAHRHYATKALGMLGNPAAIPELIPLVYHYNMNTRWEAQVSLVRLTGQNFGTDAQAWGEWYTENRDNFGENLLVFDATPVDWTFGSDNAELRHWSDPKVQEEFDNQRFGQSSAVPSLASESEIDPKQVPKIVKMFPKNGAKDVDPNISQVYLTFDIPMGNGRAWASNTADGTALDHDPDQTVFWTADGLTCVAPVKLQPNKRYVVYLNIRPFIGFASIAGVPSEGLTYSFGHC
ncbi:MAG: hypothetical protein FWG73_00885, partial [Planctomycetaceae bacterium]|nr:hypothetical protein [Planctomycetaceae bacterium]